MASCPKRVFPRRGASRPNAPKKPGFNQSAPENQRKPDRPTLLEKLDKAEAIGFRVFRWLSVILAIGKIFGLW